MPRAFIVNCAALAIIFNACSKDKRGKNSEAEIEPARRSSEQNLYTLKPDALNDLEKIPSLTAFRAGLLAALERGDQSEVLDAFSEIIEFTPGLPAGQDGVVEIWGLDGTRHKLQSLLTLFSMLLSQGGCVEIEDGDSTFTAPYYNCFPSDMADKCGISGCGVISPDGADLFHAPSKEAPRIKMLDRNEIIHSFIDTICSPEFNQCEWRKVSTFNGLTGFVPAEKVLSKWEGFLWLVKEEKGWKIRVLKGPGIPIGD